MYFASEKNQCIKDLLKNSDMYNPNKHLFYLSNVYSMIKKLFLINTGLCLFICENRRFFQQFSLNLSERKSY